MYRLILGCSIHTAYFLISYHPFTLTPADFLLPSVSLILIIFTVKSHLEVPFISSQFKGRVKRFDQSYLHNMIKHPKADKRTRDSVTGGYQRASLPSLQLTVLNLYRIDTCERGGWGQAVHDVENISLFPFCTAK